MLFDSVSILVQAELSSCLVGLMRKKIKIKNIIPKKSYKCGLVLFYKNVRNIKLNLGFLIICNN
jgi:hypothetical protein